MKKLLCILLIACIAPLCAGEADEPEYIGIIRIISRCTLLTSFEGAPEGELARQAVTSYYDLAPDSALAPEEAYALIFAEGEYAAPEDAVPAPEDCVFEAEEAQILTDSLIKVNVTVYRDEGEGMEFDCAFYTYFSVENGAYRLSKVFFPD